MDKCVIDPGRECIGAAKTALLEKRIEDLESWKDESKKFHNTFYDWQRGQIARDARLDVQLQNIETSLNKLVEWQGCEQAKPGKRWDTIVEKVILAVVAAVVGFVLAQIGL